MPIRKSYVLLKDPTIHRWKKGPLAMLFDMMVSAAIIFLLVSNYKFGTVASQRNIRDESMTTFEIEFA